MEAACVDPMPSPELTRSSGSATRRYEVQVVPPVHLVDGESFTEGAEVATALTDDQNDQGSDYDDEEVGEDDDDEEGQYIVNGYEGDGDSDDYGELCGYDGPYQYHTEMYGLDDEEDSVDDGRQRPLPGGSGQERQQLDYSSYADFSAQELHEFMLQQQQQSMLDYACSLRRYSMLETIGEETPEELRADAEVRSDISSVDNYSGVWCWGDDLTDGAESVIFVEEEARVRAEFEAEFDSYSDDEGDGECEQTSMEFDFEQVEREPTVLHGASSASDGSSTASTTDVDSDRTCSNESDVDTETGGATTNGVADFSSGDFNIDSQRISLTCSSSESTSFSDEPRSSSDYVNDGSSPKDYCVDHNCGANVETSGDNEWNEDTVQEAGVVIKRKVSNAGSLCSGDPSEREGSWLDSESEGEETEEGLLKAEYQSTPPSLGLSDNVCGTSLPNTGKSYDERECTPNEAVADFSPTLNYGSVSEHLPIFECNEYFSNSTVFCVDVRSATHEDGDCEGDMVVGQLFTADSSLQDLYNHNLPSFDGRKIDEPDCGNHGHMSTSLNNLVQPGDHQTKPHAVEITSGEKILLRDMNVDGSSMTNIKGSCSNEINSGVANFVDPCNTNGEPDSDLLLVFDAQCEERTSTPPKQCTPCGGEFVSWSDAIDAYLMSLARHRHSTGANLSPLPSPPSELADWDAATLEQYIEDHPELGLLPSTTSQDSSGSFHLINSFHQITAENKSNDEKKQEGSATKSCLRRSILDSDLSGRDQYMCSGSSGDDNSLALHTAGQQLTGSPSSPSMRDESSADSDDGTMFSLIPSAIHHNGPHNIQKSDKNPKRLTGVKSEPDLVACEVNHACPLVTTTNVDPVCDDFANKCQSVPCISSLCLNADSLDDNDGFAGGAGAMNDGFSPCSPLKKKTFAYDIGADLSCLTGTEAACSGSDHPFSATFHQSSGRCRYAGFTSSSSNSGGDSDSAGESEASGMSSDDFDEESELQSHRTGSLSLFPRFTLPGTMRSFRSFDALNLAGVDADSEDDCTREVEDLSEQEEEETEEDEARALPTFVPVASHRRSWMDGIQECSEQEEKARPSSEDLSEDSGYCDWRKVVPPFTTSKSALLQNHFAKSSDTLPSESPSPTEPNLNTVSILKATDIVAPATIIVAHVDAQFYKENKLAEETKHKNGTGTYKQISNAIEEKYLMDNSDDADDRLEVLLEHDIERRHRVCVLATDGPSTYGHSDQISSTTVAAINPLTVHPEESSSDESLEKTNHQFPDSLVVSLNDFIGGESSTDSCYQLEQSFPVGGECHFTEEQIAVLSHENNSTDHFVSISTASLIEHSSDDTESQVHSSDTADTHSDDRLSLQGSVENQLFVETGDGLALTHSTENESISHTTVNKEVGETIRRKSFSVHNQVSVPLSSADNSISDIFSNGVNSNGDVKDVTDFAASEADHKIKSTDHLCDDLEERFSVRQQQTESSLDDKLDNVFSPENAREPHTLNREPSLLSLQKANTKYSSSHESCHAKIIDAHQHFSTTSGGEQVQQQSHFSSTLFTPSPVTLDSDTMDGFRQRVLEGRERAARSVHELVELERACRFQQLHYEEEHLRKRLNHLTDNTDIDQISSGALAGVNEGQDSLTVGSHQSSRTEEDNNNDVKLSIKAVKGGDVEGSSMNVRHTSCEETTNSPIKDTIVFSECAPDLINEVALSTTTFSAGVPKNRNDIGNVEKSVAGHTDLSVSGRSESPGSGLTHDTILAGSIAHNCSSDDESLYRINGNNCAEVKYLNECFPLDVSSGSNSGDSIVTRNHTLSNGHIDIATISVNTSNNNLNGKANDVFKRSDVGRQTLPAYTSNSGSVGGGARAMSLTGSTFSVNGFYLETDVDTFHSREVIRVPENQLQKEEQQQRYYRLRHPSGQDTDDEDDDGEVKEQTSAAGVYNFGAFSGSIRRYRPHKLKTQSCFNLTAAEAHNMAANSTGGRHGNGQPFGTTDDFSADDDDSCSASQTTPLTEGPPPSTRLLSTTSATVHTYDDRASLRKSAEFLLRDENKMAAWPPENQLRAAAMERVPSEHELRIRRSLQKLDLPDWYKNSPLMNQVGSTDGFILRRDSAGSGAGSTGRQTPRWEEVRSRRSHSASNILGSNSRLSCATPTSCTGSTTGSGRQARSVVIAQRVVTPDWRHVKSSRESLLQSPVSPSPYSQYYQAAGAGTTTAANSTSMSRWSSSRLSTTSTATTASSPRSCSPTGSLSQSTTSTHNYRSMLYPRQPYLGWRSSERLAREADATSGTATAATDGHPPAQQQHGGYFYRSPAERMSHGPGYYALRYGSWNRSPATAAAADAGHVATSNDQSSQPPVDVRSDVTVNVIEPNGCPDSTSGHRMEVAELVREIDKLINRNGHVVQENGGSGTSATSSSADHETESPVQNRRQVPSPSHHQQLQQSQLDALAKMSPKSAARQKVVWMESSFVGVRPLSSASTSPPPPEQVDRSPARTASATTGLQPRSPVFGSPLPESTTTNSNNNYNRETEQHRRPSLTSTTLDEVLDSLLGLPPNTGNSGGSSGGGQWDGGNSYASGGHQSATSSFQSPLQRHRATHGPLDDARAASATPPSSLYRPSAPPYEQSDDTDNDEVDLDAANESIIAPPTLLTQDYEKSFVVESTVGLKVDSPSHHSSVSSSASGLIHEAEAVADKEEEPHSAGSDLTTATVASGSGSSRCSSVSDRGVGGVGRVPGSGDSMSVGSGGQSRSSSISVSSSSSSSSSSTGSATGSGTSSSSTGSSTSGKAAAVIPPPPDFIDHRLAAMTGKRSDNEVATVREACAERGDCERHFEHYHSTCTTSTAITSGTAHPGLDEFDPILGAAITTNIELSADCVATVAPPAWEVEEPAYLVDITPSSLPAQLVTNNVHSPFVTNLAPDDTLQPIGVPTCKSGPSGSSSSDSFPPPPDSAQFEELNRLQADEAYHSLIVVGGCSGGNSGSSGGGSGGNSQQISPCETNIDPYVFAHVTKLQPILSSDEVDDEEGEGDDSDRCYGDDEDDGKQEVDYDDADDLHRVAVPVDVQQYDQPFDSGIGCSGFGIEIPLHGSSVGPSNDRVQDDPNDVDSDDVGSCPHTSLSSHLPPMSSSPPLPLPASVMADLEYNSPYDRTSAGTTFTSFAHHLSSSQERRSDVETRLPPEYYSPLATLPVLASGTSSDEATTTSDTRRSSQRSGKHARQDLQLDDTVIVKCSHEQCGHSAELRDARNTYKTCHNCFSFYCSRECRKDHWVRHRRVCMYGRIRSMCKQALQCARDTPATQLCLSRLARTGFLTQGRGFVKLLFRNTDLALSFLRHGWNQLEDGPVYVAWKDLIPQEMGDEVYRAVVDLCQRYDPETKFVLLAAVYITREVPLQAVPHWEREIVAKCARLPLHAKSLIPVANPDLPEPTTTLIITGPPPPPPAAASSGVGEVDQRRVREACLVNIQEQLLERGVNLRAQFSEAYARLLAYVERDDPFPPLTLYPRDGRTGQTFMCVIVPDNSVAGAAAGSGGPAAMVPEWLKGKYV